MREITDKDANSVRVNIEATPRAGSSTQGSPYMNIWEPGVIESDESSGFGGPHAYNPNAEAPEKELTLFAMRLAILEKLASSLGTLAFIWATVVLLGGFAIALSNRDFWFVTIILVIEGARIFGRSGEIEWQHQSTWTFANGARDSVGALHRVRTFFNPVSEIDRRIEDQDQMQAPSRFGSSRTWNFREVPLLSFWGRGCMLKNVGEVLIWIQVGFAIGSMILSLFQLVSQNFGKLVESEIEDQDQMQAPSRFGSSRTWNFCEVPLLSFWGRGCMLKNVGEVLIWIQVGFAIGSMILSLFQLVSQNFGKLVESEMNRDTALNLFYALACANDMLFLMEKFYWYWKIHRVKLLESVRKKCGFRSSRAATDLIKRFFYDVYSVCINESIFSGLKKDIVSYAEKLLESGEPDKNLMGAQILMRFVNHEQFSFDTIHKVGTSGKTLDRLIEMLSWKIETEVDIRMLATKMVSRISGKRKGSIRIARIPGSLEVIASLLYNGKNNNNNIHNESGYHHTSFNLEGLLILRNLAGDHENCEKIRKSPGLISKIIKFTATSPSLLLDEHPVESQIKLVRRALQVLLLLASSKGDTRNVLRQQISTNVFFVSNIREILKNGQQRMVLQKISLQILTFLAMDEEATERIAGTGGVINLLLEIFFKPGVSEETSVSDEAGEALSMLTLKSQKTCNMILRECNVVTKLVDMLTEQLQCPYASRILRNVLTRTITENETLLEVLIGLVVAACLLMELPDFKEQLIKANIDLTLLVKRLIGILNEYKYPEIKVPRLRRYVIELSIWMMKTSAEYHELFKTFSIEQKLQSVAETTTELENFHLFSGSTGLYQHTSPVVALVEEALELLRHGSSTGQ